MAISKPLCADVSRYVNADDKVPDCVREVLTELQRRDPLRLGFAARPDWIAGSIGALDHLHGFFERAKHAG